MRLTHQRHLGIIAISHSLKQILHPKQSDNPFGMRDIRVGEQPQFDFSFVDILEELPQFKIRGDDGVEGKSVVDFLVVVEGVDFVVED